MCRLFLFRYEIFNVKTKETRNVLLSFFHLMQEKRKTNTNLTSGYLDLVQRLEFGVDHLQKNAV